MKKSRFISLVITVFIGCQETLYAQPDTDQLIIQYKNTESSAARSKTTQRKHTDARFFSGITGRLKTRLSNSMEVFKLDRRLSADELQELISTLQKDEDIERVEPDYPLQLHAVPNDTSYTSQWNIRAKTDIAGSANVEPAWDFEKGASDLVIAILDTGVLPHGDIVNRLTTGYDMINDLSYANDGDLRDSDASDPGNWCGAVNSNWHGTHVAGIIAADTNNAAGVSGINWHSKIQSVRVMGKCGGYTSDLIAGIRWAAGLNAALFVPLNPTPAKVINISAGTETTCSSALQAAIDAATAEGAIVITSAGNDNKEASLFSPSNCNNVISVGAVTYSGARAGYSNYGTRVDLSAPGGNTSTGILSTLDSGTTIPVADSYGELWGTSMAAPHVAGVVSLMLSINPGLTFTDVRDILISTARAFPTGTGNDCNTTMCGAGIIDALEAVLASKTNLPPTITTTESLDAYPGDTVSLNAAASDPDGSIASTVWSQTSGIAVALINATELDASFVAPDIAGIYEFTLNVIDNEGASTSKTVQVTITLPVPENLAPTANAGQDISAHSGDSVVLNGSAFDVDGSIVFSQWTQVSGPSVELSDPASLTPKFTAPANNATLEFQLSVNDDSGAQANDIVRVTISEPSPPPVDANLPPSANAGENLHVNAGDRVSLKGGAQDPDGSISFVQWQQVSGSAVALTNANSLESGFTAPAANGTLVFTLLVRDDRGAESSDTLEVFVTVPAVVNVSPTISLESSITVSGGEEVTLTASVNDPDGTIESVEWHQISGESVALNNVDNIPASFIAPNIDGTISFELTVTDNNGGHTSKVIEVLISNSDTLPVNDVSDDLTSETDNSETSGNDSPPIKPATANKASLGAINPVVLTLVVLFGLVTRRKARLIYNSAGV